MGIFSDQKSSPTRAGLLCPPAQIPGFWNPKVKMVQLEFSLIKNRAPHGLGFCAHRSILFSSAGSIPVSPNRHGSTREQSSLLNQPELVRWCAWPGVKSIIRWAQKPSMVKWCNWDFLWSGILWSPSFTINTLKRKRERERERERERAYWHRFKTGTKCSSLITLASTRKLRRNGQNPEKWLYFLEK